MSAAKFIDVEANREHFPPLKLNSPFYSKFHTDRMLSFLDIQLIYVFTMATFTTPSAVITLSLHSRGIFIVPLYEGFVLAAYTLTMMTGLILLQSRIVVESGVRTGLFRKSIPQGSSLKDRFYHTMSHLQLRCATVAVSLVTYLNVLSCSMLALGITHAICVVYPNAVRTFLVYSFGFIMIQSLIAVVVPHTSIEAGILFRKPTLVTLPYVAWFILSGQLGPRSILAREDIRTTERLKRRVNAEFRSWMMTGPSYCYNLRTKALNNTLA